MNNVLMYHSIGSSFSDDNGVGLYSVSVENFRRQMEHIKKLGTAPFGEGLLITFDDGDITNYQYAYPILKEFGLRAYFFVIVSKISAQGYMNWEQMKELMDSGMIVGSHGMTHTILTGQSDEALDYEIKESKKILEKRLGAKVDYFSVPRGFYNKKIITKTKEAGYKAVFTSNIGDSDGFKFGRVPVKENWGLEYFMRVISNGYCLKDKAQELIKNSSKKILGAKNYDRIRSRILKK